MAELSTRTVVYDITYYRIFQECSCLETRCPCVGPDQAVRVTIETDVEPDWEYGHGASIGEIYQAVRRQAGLGPDDAFGIAKVTTVVG